MINEQFLSNELRYFFKTLLIKTIIYELDWHLVIQYLIYLINNEDKHRDIQLISDLFQLLLSFYDINSNEQSFEYSSDEKIQLIQVFQLILLFLNQTSIKNLITLKTKFYIPSLSFENEIDNINFLIYRTIQYIIKKL
ncbi:unnamed protein product [Rotaria sordida]|uniref:Uncharacterized protein n=1 Tax=Rotaria sordida TaxID=392033 RepID=A0A819J819_9BILA|nr:unnamed protein product [Rotaria sordida]CAF1139785.1 unnamed protein product [Rotaria sordida]CAF1142961.1 unnamed protein product [Rotaria sordida]CAF1151839.1 unnamed protein product [Rotaria sordida]CAF3762014.1 unnamed protein product [Rotaria sordida]